MDFYKTLSIKVYLETLVYREMVPVIPNRSEWMQFSAFISLDMCH